MYAYPFVHTALNAVSLHRGSSQRRIDIVEVRGVLLNAINAMLLDLRDFARGQTEFSEPNVRLVFAGYSWKQKRFIISKYFFNPGTRRFVHSEVGSWRSVGKHRRLVILGDPDASHSARRRAIRDRSASAPSADEDVGAMAKRRLLDRLRNKGVFDGHGLDMEPFEVLRDMLREEASPFVGGPPQLLKVYPHMNAQPFGIRWPAKSNRIAVLGRVLARGEKAHIPVLNPDTLQVERSERGLATL
jgi:hypothetical protein